MLNEKKVEIFGIKNQDRSNLTDLYLKSIQEILYTSMYTDREKVDLVTDKINYLLREVR